MDISAIFLGKFVFLFIVVLVVVMAVICFKLGKRKAETPVLASVIGALTAYIPPLALIYLAALVLKTDLPSTDNPA